MRWYHPGLCQFLTADPSGFNNGPNVYGMNRGDPVNLLDSFELYDDYPNPFGITFPDYDSYNGVQPGCPAFLIRWENVAQGYLYQSSAYEAQAAAIPQLKEFFHFVAAQSASLSSAVFLWMWEEQKKAESAAQGPQMWDADVYEQKFGAQRARIQADRALAKQIQGLEDLHYACVDVMGSMAGLAEPRGVFRATGEPVWKFNRAGVETSVKVQAAVKNEASVRVEPRSEAPSAPAPARVERMQSDAARFRERTQMAEREMLINAKDPQYRAKYFERNPTANRGLDVNHFPPKGAAIAAENLYSPAAEGEGGIPIVKLQGLDPRMNRVILGQGIDKPAKGEVMDAMSRDDTDKVARILERAFQIH